MSAQSVFAFHWATRRGRNIQLGAEFYPPRAVGDRAFSPPLSARGARLKKIRNAAGKLFGAAKNLWKAKRAFPAAIMLPSGAGARLFIDACRADFDNICAQISALPAQSGSGKRFAENKQAEKSKKKRADWKIKWFSATQHARGRKFQRRRAKKFPKRESAENRGLAPSCARRGRKKSGLRQPANPLFRDISAISRRLCSARASLWSRASRGR